MDQSTRRSERLAEKRVDTRTTSEKRKSLNDYWREVADSVHKKKNSEEELDSFEVKEKPRKKFFAKEREATEEVTLTFRGGEKGSF